VYKGSSPGYVPTAYPQIARALEDLANNIPEELNLEVEKGYALVTDFPVVVIVAAIIASAIVGGVGTFVSVYSSTGDWQRATLCAIPGAVISAWAMGLGFTGAAAGIFLGIGFGAIGQFWPTICSMGPKKP